MPTANGLLSPSGAADVPLVVPGDGQAVADVTGGGQIRYIPELGSIAGSTSRGWEAIAPDRLFRPVSVSFTTFVNVTSGAVVPFDRADFIDTTVWSFTAGTDDGPVWNGPFAIEALVTVALSVEFQGNSDDRAQFAIEYGNATAGFNNTAILGVSMQQSGTARAGASTICRAVLQPGDMIRLRNLFHQGTATLAVIGSTAPMTSLCAVPVRRV